MIMLIIILIIIDKFGVWPTILLFVLCQFPLSFVTLFYLSCHLSCYLSMFCYPVLIYLLCLLVYPYNFCSCSRNYNIDSELIIASLESVFYHIMWNVKTLLPFKSLYLPPLCLHVILCITSLYIENPISQWFNFCFCPSNIFLKT